MVEQTHCNIFQVRIFFCSKKYHTVPNMKKLAIIKSIKYLKKIFTPNHSIKPEKYGSLIIQKEFILEQACWSYNPLDYEQRLTSLINIESQYNAHIFQSYY